MRSLTIGLIVVCICGALLLTSKTIHHRRAKSTSPNYAKTTPVEASNLTFPIILPGDTCENIRARYGKESKADPPINRTWKLNNMSISVFTGTDCIAKASTYFVEGNRLVTTPDGITLGKDTIQTATQKLQPKLAGNGASVWEGEGHVHAELVIPPQPSFPFWVSYDWAMDDQKADKITSKREPLISDFSDEPVSSVGIEAHEPVQSVTMGTPPSEQPLERIQ